LDLLHKSYLSPEEMADLLTMLTIPETKTVLRQWLTLIDNIKVHGVKTLVETNSQIARDADLTKESLELIDSYADKEPWLIQEIRDSFKAVVRELFAMKIGLLDPLTQVGAIAFFGDQETAEDWKASNPEVFISWAKRGNDATLKGKKKRGKTNFLLLIGEIGIRYGFDVVGNVKVFPPVPPNYTYCAKLSDMLLAICKSVLAGRNVLLLFDESALYWNKIEAVRPKNIDMNKLCLVFGKFHCNMVFCAHYDENIPPVVAKNADAEFEKTATKNVYVHVKDGIKVGPKLITSVPATTWGYDPDQIQYFSLDMDVNNIFEWMATIPDGKNQWEALIEYVTKHKGETGEKALSDEQVALFLKRTKKKSIGEISSILEKPKSTIQGMLERASG